jgi:hypothetical protein
MANLKDFFNKVSNNNRIFTAEDIGEMTGNEYEQNEKAIFHQLQNLGIPRRNQLNGNPDVVYVHAYIKADGTHVKAHYRSKNGGAATGYATNTNNSQIKEFKPADFSYLDKSNLVKKYLHKYNEQANINRPDAKELMNIGLSGFENLPKHSEFSVFQPEAVEYVNNQLSIKNSKGLEIPTGWNGIIYDKNSGFSKRLSNSPELQEQVMKFYDNKTKSFTSNQILIDFKQDKNLGYSIGHGTILNPKVENGEFKAILFDKYDFHWLSKEKLPDDKMRFINNGAAFAERTPILTNYYVIIPVRFRIGN